MEANNELKYIYSNVNEMLKFGEAKHAGLMVFNGAIIIGILSCYNDISTLFLKWSLVIGFLFIGISLVLSILSQFPKTQNNYSKNKNIDRANIYFYGHLSCFTLNEFINEYHSLDPCFTANEFDKCLINQIIVISKIANRKFCLFKIAVCSMILGLTIIVLGTLIKMTWL